ncbi:DUF4943 domain-containing protein [Chitinophaga pendula]|uniref:DUF4943 family protein n=1 Tax=Chitinophaga TaxID=79328 RepID=UPI000BB09DDA|nr:MULTISPECIES: DUF4943 family protein [Chitinophaga]ASZ11712.1 hypothetical protein CK934_12460 [Chitinophaga sp. MD30]UCJ05270.1 DUF4943 domain-containing protein [Chitinophaga pendula]
MTQVLLMLSLFAAVTFNNCNHTSDKGPMTAKQYVSLLKANKYPKYDLVPALRPADIAVLIQHVNDEQVIDNYPIPAMSAAQHGPQQVGMIVLYTIESIRLERKQGASTRPYISDTADPKRRPSLQEVAPYYVRWWEHHKDNDAAALKQSSPLAGTTLTW